MLVVSSDNSGCDLIFLVSRNWCRDLTLSAFTAFLCRDLNSMSPTHFCCQPPCFLVTAPLFMLRRYSVVLSLQAGHDSKLLVCLFSCSDVDIRSQPSIFFNHCNSCHDHPFFLSNRNLISQSQQFPSIFLFLVATLLFCPVLEYMT